MDKLIELLNEYEETENLNAYKWEIEWEDIIWYNKFWWWYETINVSESVIISKWYEFIAWIVEKKKFKPYHAYTDFLYWASSRVEFEDWPTIPSVNWQLYDSILCGLALSDNPIELLSNIIK